MGPRGFVILLTLIKSEADRMNDLSLKELLILGVVFLIKHMNKE